MSDSPTTPLEAFAADYFVMQGISEKRRYLTLRELTRLSEHAGVKPEAVDEAMLRAYLAAQLGADLHVNTVRKHLSAIKTFYRWAWRTRRISAEQWMRIADVKPPRGSSSQGRPRPYQLREIERFWDELDARWPTTSELMIKRYLNGTSGYKRIATHATHLQMQAIVSLALFGGLRSAEIRYSTLDDLHPINEYICVRGKSPFGERQGYREVPYTEEGRQMVGEWLAFRENVLRPDHDAVWLVLSAQANPRGTFPSHPLDPISDAGWLRMMHYIGGWELHRLRHTCATEWLRAGVKLERISKLLGHATIGQTLGYADLVRDDVARDMHRVEVDFVKAVGRRVKSYSGPKAA